MVSPFQTLRFKLTSSYVIIFGLLQALLWVIIYAVVDQHLNERFDNELLRRGQAIMVALDASSRQNPDKSPAARARAVLSAFQSEQIYALVCIDPKHPAIKTADLEGVVFPYDSPKEGDTTHPRFTTLQNEASTVWAGGEPVRILTIDNPASGPGNYVQVASSLGPVQRVGQGIQRLLVVFVALSLLLAGISSWLVAGRSLGPIGIISRDARNISAASLHRRIPVPKNRDEVTEMVVALNDMFGRLERQFKNEHDFISNVSHELKTPLAVMLGHVQNRLKQGEPNAESLAFLQSAEEELWRMLKIVESSLILSRARNAQRLPLATHISVEDAILNSIKNCSKEAAAKKVQIIPRITGTENMAEPYVVGDEDLLISMFENLISNAIRYTPGGETIEIDAHCLLKEVQIRIRDKGPGIPEEHQNKVFEFCYQIEPAGKQSGKSGIGLTIVKAVAELHGGFVTLRNREEGGCEFTVRLPLADSR